MELKVNDMEKELVDLKSAKGTVEQVRTVPAHLSLTRGGNHMDYVKQKRL